MNTRRLPSMIFLSALLSAGCASQLANQEQAASNAATTAAEADLKPYKPGNDLTCRMVQVTGSHMYRKQCFTEAEMKQMREDAHDWMLTKGKRGGTTRVRDELDPREKNKYEND